MSSPSVVSRSLGGLRLIRRQAGRYRPYFGWFRALSLAIRDRPGASGEAVVQCPGFGALTVRLGTTDLRTLHHCICEKGYEFPPEWGIDSPSWIIDAGANAGYATAYFAARFPSARIVAIEPDSENFALLERNTSGLANVVTRQAALWSSDGSVTLADPGRGKWGLRVAEGRADDSAACEVDAVSMSTLINSLAIDRIGILKIDIEGGERQVLAASSDWMGKVDAIAIELHDRSTPGCSEALERSTRDFTRRATRGEDTFLSRPADRLQTAESA